MDSRYTEPNDPSSHYRIQGPSTCHACGSEIGVRERQLTWRIRDGEDVFTYDYCSDGCLPATAPETP